MQRFKKILSTTITVTTISWSIGIGTLIPLLPVNANVTTLTPTALISSPLSLNSSSTAAQGVALGINVIKSNGGTETVSSVGVLLNPSGNFTLSDLASLDTTTNSGLALYVDDKTSGSSYGTFNATDDDVITGATPSPMQVNRFAKLTPTATTVVGQGDSLALTAGDIVFAATTASPDNSMGGGSYAWLLVTGLNETGTVVGTASTSLRLNGNNANPSYAGSSRFSVFTPQKTGVFNLNSGGGGTTTFSDASEPAVGDIVIYGRSNQSMGSPQWGIVTNSFTGSASPVNGSNISSQGNGNYRISKIAGTTGVYTVANGSFTASSGTYTSPQIGDLVLYQSGFNTANWGIITNATLVGGTFAINGQVVTNGTYSISKPTGYGATSVTTTDTSLAITAGDATFAYATNNPIPTFSMMGGSSFGPGATWYSVTTGGTGVTSSALRINDASGAPSFGWYVSLTANNTPSSNIAIPQDNAVNNSGDEFFVVVRSSANPGSGSSFSVGIHSNLFQIQNGGPPQAMISAVTAAISLTPADSSAPTATSGGPPDAQTGVSVEATVDQSYSEALNQASTECANAGACASFTNVTLKVCTGADQSSANLACGASNTSVGPQLCTSVTRSNGNVKITCNHDALATGKWFVSHYELIADASGNAQGQGAAITRRFKTGTTGTANTTPPFVQNSQPGQGSQNHPLNAPITLSFNVAMATTGGGAITNDANIGLFVESA
ncbi:MAG: hypothetical protein Q7S48_02330, partial [bacterium]|nr:hypothetical protein [bacterium]